MWGASSAFKQFPMEFIIGQGRKNQVEGEAPGPGGTG